ncbi:Spc97/Spc98 family protein [Arthroderma uncinatum]|uniref:Spc97/Spc98 family protein n=1 Tax=Arthroderma uncinatum TaxID=74035 RepID=UPI00144AAFF6|nr:Spc97/Spc98 family protein [Arthroderma uncinatum]KAF3482218.1 Spc97/Spc98 family protein [Arthroderma uncinatum]
MLHEILLSLSGQPSPIFEQPAKDRGSAQDGFPLLSPQEKALLEPIARLSRLHGLLRVHSAHISSSHPSTICRAASTTIATEYLGSFQEKILEVERSILGKDAGYVGGYGIVPLSTVVGEFSPWVRKMEWLWDTSQFMLPYVAKDAKTKGTAAGSGCSGAALIDYLRTESQTGYTDVEEISLGLIKAAEAAWMRQLSVFILYGHLPSLGREDFFIQEGPSSGDRRVNTADFQLQPDLVPKFVSRSTATSILFVGRSLNHIRARGKFPAGEEAKHSSSQMTLHGEFIRCLSSLTSPISMISLANAISEIRLSLSHTVLSQLLPLHKIMEVLSLLHNFLLLGRGEFAMALVSHADERISTKHKRTYQATSVEETLDVLTLKESEVSTVLTQAWTELYSIPNAEDPVDDELDLARSLLRLSIEKDTSISKDMKSANQILTYISDVNFSDILLGSPTTLSLHINPPLDLFLAQSDMIVYSKIHSYLLGIRRGQMRLGDLWKRTSLRRVHPSPWGPPMSNKPGGRANLKLGRERQKKRAALMRRVWASGSAALFVFSELGSYLQGEVIGSSWRHFKGWLNGGRPQSSSGQGSRPGTASSTNTLYHSHDPETINIAHRTYLAHLIQSLFLTDVPFTRTLRALIAHVDRFVSLLGQLQTIQQNLDLETDEGVFDSLQDYSQDEARVWAEVSTARTSLERSMTDLIARLRDIDDHRITKGATSLDASTRHVAPELRWVKGNEETLRGRQENNIFVPWRAAGVDRLLMRLEFGGASADDNAADGLDFGGNTVFEE